MDTEYLWRDKLDSEQIKFNCGDIWKSGRLISISGCSKKVRYFWSTSIRSKTPFVIHCWCGTCILDRDDPLLGRWITEQESREYICVYRVMLS
jgi:hypothetical protein